MHKKIQYCYLCSKELVEQIITIDEVNYKAIDHSEHIFQQAIGGTLNVKGILCKECGGLLSKEIDTPFLKMFTNITSRLYFERDRHGPTKKPTNKSSNGIIEFQGEIIEIYMLGDNVYPIRPKHFKKDNKLYLLMQEVISNKKNKNDHIQDYIKSQVKPNYPDFDQLNIVLIRNLKGCGEVILEHNLDNKYFQQGFAKIAIGFASYKGVQAKLLNKVLDIENKKIIDGGLIFCPYFPTSLVEKSIEHFRFLTGGFENLFHSIKLKNFGKDLIAYIEIFGLYQISILLSDCFTGKDIYETYTQPLFKKKSSLLKALPHNIKDLYIDCVHKLRDETRSKINLSNPEEVLKLINNDIEIYDMQYVKSICIDKYYEKFLGLYTTAFVLAMSPQSHCEEYESYVYFLIKELAIIPKDDIINEMVIARNFCKDIKNFKLTTCGESYGAKHSLVLYQNLIQVQQSDEAIKKYIEAKFQQLNNFLEKYSHELLSEGEWEVYKIKE